MPVFLARWESAKTKFENATGEKKPKPTGFFKSFFNHTGLTSALKDMDAVAPLLDTGGCKPEDNQKVLAKGEEKSAKLTKAVAAYLKILEKDAKMEKADNNEKTDLYRNLKVLSAELKVIDASAIQLVDQKRAMMRTDLGAKEKAAQIIRTSLASACANAVLAVKKVQADPTPAVFNELFAISDSPGRKIQVQLVSARNQLAAGKMKQVNVDPGYIAEKFTPWQGATSPNNNLPDDAQKAAVIKRIEDFKGLLKLANYYSQQL